MFVSTAKGRVGNLVLYARKGDQITRAYQSQVANPRTNAQMLQRAKFANAVKFYQKAVQHFFKFAFQDQKSNETAFNAFMRHNIDRSCYITSGNVKDAYFPALGRWVLSSGSLAQAFVPAFTGSSVQFLNTGLAAESNTVAAVSSILMGQGFNAGDIVTLVFISSLVTSLDFDLTNFYDSGNLLQPQWDIRQFIIDGTDNTAIADIPRQGPVLGTLSASGGGLKFVFKNPNYSNAAGCIVTRKGSGITYASNSELVPNSVTLAMINASGTESNIAWVAQSWKSQGDAILHGSVADGQTRTTGEGESGSGSTSGGTSSGTTTTSAITSVDGSNPPITIGAATEGKTVGIEGTGLSTVAPTTSAKGVTISDFTVNDARTSASFKVVVADEYGSGSIAYMGKTIVNITNDMSTGDEI